MGQCYSCQVNNRRGPYCPNGDMSNRPTYQSQPGGRAPGANINYRKITHPGSSMVRHNSNELIDDRAALATLDDNSPVSRPKSVKTEYNTNLNRFGFRPKTGVGLKGGKSDSNSNVMTISSDSIDNIDIECMKKKDLSRNGTSRTGKDRSYEPVEGRNWKMIDDSSNTDSRSVSTQGTLGTQEDTNGNGHLTNKMEKMSLTSKGLSDKSGRNLSGSLGKGLVKPGKAPLAKFSPDKDKWVKAEASSDSGLRQPSPKGKKSAGKEQTSHPTSFSGDSAQSRLASRARGWFNKYGMRSSQKEGKNKAEGESSKLVRSKEDSYKMPSSEKAFKHEATSPVESEISTEESERQRLDSEMKDSFTKDSGIGSDSLDAQDVISRENVPRATLIKKDSVDAGSICSLNSDDLMLDLDINFDEDVAGASSTTLERSVFLGSSQNSVTCMNPAKDTHEVSRPLRATYRERVGSLGSETERPPRSRSGDSSTSGKPPVRPGSLIKRHSESALPKPRQSSIKEHRANSCINEVLTELSELLQSSTTPTKEQPEPTSPVTPQASTLSGLERRRPKLTKANRPASFPGPTTSVAIAPEEVRSPLKPPRTGPSLGDEDQLMMDVVNYRHMVQDLTAIKTMALRLKRVIQEDDLGSQAWKNGYKYGCSQPSSPLGKEGQYSFSGPPSTANTPTMDTIIQENFQLRQQINEMQNRLDEQEKTIQRLQENMNKLETSPKGKVSGGTANNPTKPRFGSSSRGLPRPSAAGGGSGLYKTGVRRSEVSSSSEQTLSSGCDMSLTSHTAECESNLDVEKDNKENLNTTTKPTTKDKQATNAGTKIITSSTGIRISKSSLAAKGSKSSLPIPGTEASTSTSPGQSKKKSSLERTGSKSPRLSGGTVKRPISKTETSASNSSLPSGKTGQSHLPAFSVRKITKKTDQLQSFSKISKK